MFSCSCNGTISKGSRTGKQERADYLGERNIVIQILEPKARSPSAPASVDKAAVTTIMWLAQWHKGWIVDDRVFGAQLVLALWKQGSGRA
jgi:hypothetical protein